MFKSVDGKEIKAWDIYDERELYRLYKQRNILYLESQLLEYKIKTLEDEINYQKNEN